MSWVVRLTHDAPDDSPSGAHTKSIAGDLLDGV
jgi:hypothetical protein